MTVAIWKRNDKKELHLVDFSSARQCWLAAFWAAQGLKANFKKTATGEMPKALDCVESLAPHAVFTQALGDQDLVEDLAIYGPARVLPVLVFPVYAWLTEALCDVVREVGRYHQVPNLVVETHHGMLLGQLPWPVSGRMETSSADVAAEAGSGQRLFDKEWEWLTYFWRDNGDSLPSFVADVKEVRRSLPRGGAHFMGGFGAFNLKQDAEPDGFAPSGRKDGSAVMSAIKIEHLNAWDASTAVKRVALMQDLLRDLGGRWAEL